MPEKDPQPVNEQQVKLREDIGFKLNGHIQTLVRFGGFDLVETTVQGTQNMNPQKKARREIFLTNAESVADMAMKCQEQADKAEALLKSNLAKAVEVSSELERSYRTVALFYLNTESQKLKNVSIVNAAMEQLGDLDNPIFMNQIEEEFRLCYDNLDLRRNYSLLVLPGYLGSNAALEMWARTAHKNKVMLITDFRHLTTADDVIELFEAANHAGGDAHLANVMMTSNWVVGREQYADLGEEEPLFVPPSAALAGRVYQTLMSQVAAGKKWGALLGLNGVCFETKKAEIANMEKLGLIPMVSAFSKVMAFSGKTLFNGSNLGLQTYSVVRVFDWVTKVLVDFLNRRAFENFNGTTQKEIRTELVRFLESIQGAGNLIEKFKILRFEQDPKQKDRIYLDIHLKPFFPAKSYLIKLDGTRGDDPDSPEWKASYEQE
jgi:Type VI secretion system, TssC, VipB